MSRQRAAPVRARRGGRWHTPLEIGCAIDDPLLIRRPLLQVGDRRESGFNQARVDAWIGLRQTANPVTDACIKQPTPEHRR